MFTLMNMQNLPKTLKVTEVASYLIGTSLLLYALSSWASGQLDSKVAAEVLASQQVSTAPNTDLSLEAKFVDWSANRIVAWRETLGDGGPAAFAMLSVPTAGINVPVFEGTDDRNLNAGAGLIEGTDKPGFDYGNTGIAGHRDGFFRGLQNVTIGESITISANGEELSYRISDISIVDPGNIDTLLPQQNEVVTLVTCYPFYFVGHAPQRYVVQAVRQR